MTTEGDVVAGRPGDCQDDRRADPGEPTTPFAAIVLAGGSATRLGGVDKAAVRVAGRTLLDRVLAACVLACQVVVVGTPRPTARSVHWTLEQPAGGGPLAGLGAGLAVLAPSPRVVVVLATDLPYLTARDVDRLIEALPGHDAAVFTDRDGRVQPLAAAYLVSSLTRAVGRVGGLRDQPVRRALRGLRSVTVPDLGAARDCDTPVEVADASRDLTEREPVR